MRLIRTSSAVGVAVIVATVLWAGAAAAQDGDPAQPDAYVGGTTSVPTTPDNPSPQPPNNAEVLGESQLPNNAEVLGESQLPNNAEVLGESLSSAAPAGTQTDVGEVKSSTLAFTGGDVAALSIVGLGAVAVGSIFVLLRRRTSEPVA